MNTSIEEKLRLFGLNKYEALAYITIVKHAVSSAREISKFSGVPYSRIYDVLDSLEKKGWVFVESGKPLRYKANNLKSILDKIEKQTMKELSETKKIVVDELEPYFAKAVKKVGVWVIRDREKILDKVEEMIKTAKKTLYLMVPYTPEDFLSDAKRLRELVLEKNKKIEVKIIMGEKDPEMQKKLKIKVCKEKTGWTIIKDEEEVFYASPFIEGEEIGLWTDEKELVKIAIVMFKYLWQSL